MIKLLLLILISLSTATVNAGDKQASRYQITIKNITKGQPLTPAVVATHGLGLKLFALGEEASAGLKALAVDGVTDGLVSELKGNSAVRSVAIGTGVIMPGRSEEITISVEKPSFISLASMLARTNDAFAGGRFLRLPSKSGVKVAYLLNVYDAGAEVNTESCAHIPAPPCDSHEVGEAEEGGFVTAHSGIHGIGDLQVLRDAFGNAAAKVVIEKL